MKWLEGVRKMKKLITLWTNRYRNFGRRPINIFQRESQPKVGYQSIRFSLLVEDQWICWSSCNVETLTMKRLTWSPTNIHYFVNQSMKEENQSNEWSTVSLIVSLFLLLLIQSSIGDDFVKDKVWCLFAGKSPGNISFTIASMVAGRWLVIFWFTILIAWKRHQKINHQTKP